MNLKPILAGLLMLPAAHSAVAEPVKAPDKLACAEIYFTQDYAYELADVEDRFPNAQAQRRIRRLAGDFRHLGFVLLATPAELKSGAVPSMPQDLATRAGKRALAVRATPALLPPLQQQVRTCLTTFRHKLESGEAYP